MITENEVREFEVEYVTFANSIKSDMLFNDLVRGAGFCEIDTQIDPVKNRLIFYARNGQGVFTAGIDGDDFDDSGTRKRSIVGTAHRVLADIERRLTTWLEDHFANGEVYKSPATWNVKVEEDEINQPLADSIAEGMHNINIKRKNAGIVTKQTGIHQFILMYHPSHVKDVVDIMQMSDLGGYVEPMANAYITNEDAMWLFVRDFQSYPFVWDGKMLGFGMGASNSIIKLENK